VQVRLANREAADVRGPSGVVEGEMRAGAPAGLIAPPLAGERAYASIPRG